MLNLFNILLLKFKFKKKSIKNGELNNLIINKTPIGDIIKSSPFDHNRNIGGLISPNFFFKHLFTGKEKFEKILLLFMEYLNSPFDTNRIFIVEGFNGVGKTTFLKYFIKNNSGYNHIYIDFHTYAKSPIAKEGAHKVVRRLNNLINIMENKIQEKLFIDSNEEISNSMQEIKELLYNFEYVQNPIISTLQGYLERSVQAETIAMLYFIDSKFNYFTPYFSSKLIDEFKNIKRKNFKNSLSYIINSCNFSDTFLLFFTYCFLNKNSSKKTLIYFDNLDRIEIDYLSEYFQKYFAEVLSEVSKLSQDKDIFTEDINFNFNYKIIYCLRDANSAILNAHLSDSYGPPKNFRINFDSQFYKQIIDKRVAFYNKIKDADKDTTEAKIINNATKIITQFTNDWYFDNVIVNLYNSDYRKISSNLFTLSWDNSIEPLDKSLPDLIDFSFSNLYEKYLLRGSLLFGLIKNLWDRDYLSCFPFIKSSEIPQMGWCSPIRMILGYILNHCSSKKDIDLSNPTLNFKSVSITEIINAFKDIYPIDIILKTLVDCFLFHKSNWVHLITFRNEFIVDENNFVPLIKQVNNINSNHKLSKTEKELSIENELRSLNDINISINPGAFIYLKNIITHFEFYANLAGLNKPLFSVGMSRSGPPKYQYLFDLYINAVMRRVKSHILLMSAFYRNTIKSELKWSEKKYKGSEYTFKYYGKGEYKKYGLLHATRIITTHIDYIDKFRLLMIKYLNDKGKTASAVDINKRLTNKIQGYNSMFNYAEDSAAKTTFQIGFDKNIKEVHDSNYENFDLEISQLEKIFQSYYKANESLK